MSLAPLASFTGLASCSVSNLRGIPGQVRNREATSTIFVPMVALTDGSGFRFDARYMVADRDPTGGRGLAGLRRSAGTLCAGPSGPGDEGVLLAGAVGEVARNSVLPGRKPVLFVQRRRSEGGKRVGRRQAFLRRPQHVECMRRRLSACAVRKAAPGSRTAGIRLASCALDCCKSLPSTSRMRFGLSRGAPEVCSWFRVAQQPSAEPMPGRSPAETTARPRGTGCGQTLRMIKRCLLAAVPVSAR